MYRRVLPARLSRLSKRPVISESVEEKQWLLARATAISAPVSGAQLAGRCDDASGNQRLETFSHGHLFGKLQSALMRREQFPACDRNSI